MRPLLTLAANQHEHQLIDAIHVEIEAEKEHDRVYWRPLKKKLEEPRKNRA